MFGRRNPDRPLGAQSGAQKKDLDLSILDHLPDIKPVAKTDAPLPEPDAIEDEASLGPSVRQLLRDAEAAEAEKSQAAVTQQLSPVELEPLHEPQYDGAWEQSSPHVAAFFSETDVAEIYEQSPYAEPEALPTLSSELGMREEDQWDAPTMEVPVIEEAPAPEPAVAPAPVASLPARATAESLIGPEDFFDGHYRSERGVRVQGNARGSIESRQYILIEASAQVEADIAAEEIVVAGSFSGKIICHGRLEILESGKVQGSIETASLVVREGGLLDGELHMRRGEA